MQAAVYTALGSCLYCWIEYLTLLWRRDYCSLGGNCFIATQERVFCCEKIDSTSSYNEVLMLGDEHPPARTVPAMDQAWETFPVKAQVLVLLYLSLGS